MAAAKDDLEFCRRGVDRRRWRRGVLLLVSRPSIESTHASPGYGRARRSPGPLPGAGPPPGWHFVPNGVEGCADKYGCARPSFDSDFWGWVASGEQGCADEHGCARPRLLGKGDATPSRQAGEKPEGPGEKGEKPGAQSESDAGPQPGGGAIPAGHELPSKPKQVGRPLGAAQQGPATPPPGSPLTPDHRSE
jgi:hypothetical protein